MENLKAGMTIVVPYLNEEECIEQYCKATDAFASQVAFPLEIIFVDDGSTDDTHNLIKQYHFENIRKIKLISLSRNFGSHAAIRAGVLHASYDICTWMGSDLQEPFEFLTMSYERIVDGYDAVYVKKNTIKVSAINRGFSKTYSFFVRKYAVKNYPSDGIGNIVFDRKIMDLLNNNIESNSSIMLQIMDSGFKSCTISLDYNERSVGVSKWTLSKKIKVFIDSFVAFSFMPIRMVSIIGVLIFIIGVVIGIFTLVNKILNPAVPVGYSTIASILALGFGITNISLGIIAEYLWRTYDAARRRPTFIISDVIDIQGGTEE